MSCLRTIQQVGVALAIMAAAGSAPAADWHPDLFRQAETVDVRTIGTEEGEYWFPVWVVVVDEQVFVRLGSRAADRVRSTQGAPRIAIRVGEVQFNEVEFHDASPQADRVADAMAAKYWSDVLIRYFPHPMTLRLALPEGTTAAASE